MTETITWIDAKESLPDTPRYVLSITVYRRIPWIACLMDNQWRWMLRDKIPGDSVTHWAEMPKGPAPA